MATQTANVPAIEKSKNAKPLPFRYQFAASAFAGIFEILVMCEFNTKPILMRLIAKNVESVLDCFRKMIRNEGVLRLYRGITAPILMEVPKRAIKFSANDSFAPLYQNLFSAPTLTQPLAILAGASAGATESLVVVPFELVKIRLQDKTSTSSYTGLVDCLVKVIHQEGPSALYNGFEATLWRHIVWNAGYFGCIFQVRSKLPNPSTSLNPRKQKTVNDLSAGFVGGVVGTTLNTPLDVQKYASAFPKFVVVAREEGFRALYKGYLAKILRFGPGGGVLLVVYSAVLYVFGKAA
ncbi:mitochondrial carrier [Clathrospora elynae]|uniref:Mitochondrial carrier n=1 Tax=Clathrospora elynae TaxID=706981 RepID=A0A6A5SKL6_9PLEO|nr:mitochondrial carrier [Clathrospora elynae]